MQSAFGNRPHLDGSMTQKLSCLKYSLGCATFFSSLDTSWLLVGLDCLSALTGEERFQKMIPGVFGRASIFVS